MTTRKQKLRLISIMALPTVILFTLIVLKKMDIFPFNQFGYAIGYYTGVFIDFIKDIL